MIKLTQYFWHLVKKQNKKLVLPYPDASPKFGNSGKALANRISAHRFAGKVLKEEK